MKTPEQKAEEYLKSIYKECFDDPCYTPDVSQSNKDFLSGYKAANEWISVDDELPSEIGQYLVKKLHGRITIMHFHAPFDSDKRIFQWWGFGRWNDQHKQVTHWKPIE